MESEAMNAKPFRGGQAAIGPRDSYPSVENRLTAAVQQNLHDVILSRKNEHFETIASAYERLSIALDHARNDGFDFLISSGSIRGEKSANQTIPTSMPIPRSYDFEFDVRYNPPM